jgi:hypothetical protein
MKIRNQSPYGALDVPLLAREGEPYDDHGEGCVAAGEELEVTEDQARRLLPQRENWAPADAEAQAIADELFAAEDADARAVELIDASQTPSPKDDALPVWRAWAFRRGDAAAYGKTKKQLVADAGDLDGGGQS